MKSKKKFKLIFECVLVFILVFIIVVLVFGKKTTEETVKLTYSNCESYRDYNDSIDYNSSINKGFSFGSSGDILENAATSEMAVEDSISGDVDYEEEVTNDINSESKNSYDKKIRKSYNYSVESEEYDYFLSNLKSKLEELGGYIDSEDEVQRSKLNSLRTKEYTVRKDSLVVRVPSDKVDEFIKEFNNGCYILVKNEFVEDVTAQYLDLETHIESLKDEYKVLNDLLDKAESVSEIIEVQDRLTSINYEIESYEKSLEILQEDVEFSKFNISIEEVIYYTDKIESYRSDIIESWCEVIEGWLSTALPSILLVTISLIPFIALLCVAYYMISKMVLKNKQKYQQTIVIKNEDLEGKKDERESES